ncbi:Phosphoglycerate mutase [Catenulispora acidiphila DSM 44928]|uniref:Phosphoglycerate mutase n=1 Tax=Catenulispora acidiphila (strain DSM 44928 / JCM 14897 / NBRC 102108 / NRRL B-24433 / ID139908) TaxID=479433 RepID=C7QEY9_CATAD|nr:bifunctional RNase H/acid phosphatase [Catenulispora acidiphila]ACU74747.1 Phosphoglycerate mutase [Catenulispora acidiphila DSM 44928]
MARTFIVEADGASRGNPGPASYGALVADAATGEVLAELAEGLGVVTNNVAEYRGLIAGLRAAYALDPHAEVEVRMDSKLAVQQMSGVWQVKHPDIKQLAVQARTAFPQAGAVRYTWVPRAENKRADALANLALDDPAAAAAKMAEAEVMTAAFRAARAAREAGGGDGSGGEGGAAAAAASQQEALPGISENTAAEAAVTTSSSSNPAPSSYQQPSWSPAPDMGPPTTLLLLRHGATALTAEKRFSGAGDPELSAVGLQQVDAVARRLAARGGVDAIVASPLGRTVQTAQAAADALGLPVEIDPGFRETDFGLWDGYSFAEVRERWPAEHRAWLASTAVAPPQGESFDAVADRVLAARDDLIARYARRTVLVVSHVTPIKTLIRDALGAPPESLYAMELSAASLSVLTCYSDGRASMRLFNDTAHLTG